MHSGDKNLIVLFTSPLHIEPKWTKQHLVEAHSDYSQVDGVGWYDEGAEATISVKETSVGFPFKQVFRRWEGDNSTTLPTLTIRVDGPIRLVAVWETEIDPLVILATAMIVAVGVILYVKTRRRRD